MVSFKAIWAFAQEKGSLRDNQEDFFGSLEDKLFVLADGLGGEPYGETAAKLAVELSLKTYRMVEYRWFYRWRPYFVKQIIKMANRGIFNKALRNPELSGMATTLVSLLVTQRKWTIGNVGDSRAYILSQGNFQQITVDHENKNGLLTKAVGLEKHVYSDFFRGWLKNGDLFLLTTDGLTDRLKDKEIYETIKNWGETKEELEKGAKELLSLANKVATGENTSVCLVRVKQEEKSGGKTLGRQIRPRLIIGKKIKMKF